MRELLLFRHAKSRWDEPGVVDHQRDLAPRGIAAAPRMGLLLQSRSLTPDLALVSTAKRAMRTWELAAAELDRPPIVRLEERIYDAPPERLLSIVRAQEPTVRRLLLVGHNPGFEMLTAQLSGPGSVTGSTRDGEKFPTAAIAWFQLDVERWDEVTPGRARLAGFFKPRDLD